MHTIFWSENLKRRDYFGDTWEDNIRMVLSEIGWEVMDWMRLFQDRDQWWAFVNTVINIWVL
jgi:hypothetical protein